MDVAPVDVRPDARRRKRVGGDHAGTCADVVLVNLTQDMGVGFGRQRAPRLLLGHGAYCRSCSEGV